MTPRISSRLIVLSILTLFATFAALPARAQKIPEGNQTGVPAFTSFGGSNFDQISTRNGNLHISIPIISVPQRGGRSFTYGFAYDSPAWQLIYYAAAGRGSPAYYVVNEDSNDRLRWRYVDPRVWTTNYISTLVHCPFGDGFDYTENANFQIVDPEGTKHPIGLHYESTLYQCNGNQLTATATDGSGINAQIVNGNFGFPVITQKDGTRASSTWRDTNGNLNGGGLGTSVTQTGGSNYLIYTVTDSNGNPQQYRVDFTNVTIQTSLCNPNVTCYEESGYIWQMPSKLTLPTGKFYQFTWSQNGYGDLLRVDLPTGGYISYTYGTFMDFHGAHGGASIYRRSVATRTVSDGVTANTWTYVVNGPITDPLGNDEVHVIGFAGVSDAKVETQVRYYNGSSISGTLLRTVDYEYAVDSSPIDSSDINVRRIRETTTLDNGLVSKVETDYETFTQTYLGSNFTGTRLNVTQRREFAFGQPGQGTAGPLAHRTDYTYLHTNNSTYLNLNIVDRVASVVVRDGAANIVAQSQNEFDSYTEGIQASITPVNHDSSFNTSYLTRGNLTAVQRWRNDGTWFTTRNQFDDLGNVRKTTDPGTHNTLATQTPGTIPPAVPAEGAPSPSSPA
jgi:hypothetical protein